VTEAVDPTLDLFAEIDRLRKERNAVILAHYYQEPDIQDIADFLGDSLALARRAQGTEADVIVLCGVHFMAETAKVLNPEKTVLLPDLEAGCSLAESCKAEDLAALKEKHPDHLVVSYVNTTAAVKSLSDYCCTSSNAAQIVESIPSDQKIIFAPDVNLGRFVQSQIGRDMVLWPGTCEVHETFNERHVLDLLARHPEAELIAHPECEPALLRHARFVGSTKKLLDYTASSPVKTFIVATEAGILHTMNKATPDKQFIAVAPTREAGGDPTCGCSVCPHMKRNTLEKVYLCLRDLRPEILVEEELRLGALGAIERMVAVG
jgi:quinolinate synthase